MTTTTISLAHPSQDRADFIGGSDLHHLLNEKPYGCERSLWYEKRGQVPDYPLTETGAMKRGIRLEDLVAKEVEALKGWKVRRRAGLRAGAEGEFAAHIDRHIVAFDKRGPGVLEIKTMGEWMFRKVKVEGLPTRMVMQIQWYIGWQDWQWGAFAIHWPDGWDTQIFEVTRDQAIIDGLRRLADAFWVKVERGAAPDKLAPGDSRCQRCAFRTHCQGDELIKLADAEDTGSIVERPDLGGLVQHYLALKEVFGEAEAAVEDCKALLQQGMGELTAARVGGALVRYKAFEKWGWDGARMFAVLQPMTVALQSCAKWLNEYHDAKKAAEAGGDLLAEVSALATLQSKVYEVMKPYLETAAALGITAKDYKNRSVQRPLRIYGV